MINAKLIPTLRTRLTTHNSRPTHSLGFTLVEILVSLAIISLLVGIGFANYRRFSQRQLLAQTAKNLRLDLRLAANRALAGEKPGICAPTTVTLVGYRVRFPDNKSYIIEARCDVSGSLENETVKTVALPGSASDIVFSPVPSSILFKVVGQGTDVAGTATISLVGFDQTETVTVNAAGEVE